MSYLISFCAISAWLITMTFKHFAETDWDLKCHTYSPPKNPQTLTKHKKLHVRSLINENKIIFSQV